MIKITMVYVFILAAVSCCPAVSAAKTKLDIGFPRIANLWGWEAGNRDYDIYAMYDMIVISGGEEKALKEFLREVRLRNPDIIILGNGPFQNIWSPEKSYWIKDEWFLRRPDGEKVKWWVDQLYSPNLFKDAYIEAAVAENETGFGQYVREGSIQGFMFDSVVGNVSWYGEVDTDLDGVADDPEDVDVRWQQQQNVFFRKLHEKFPGAFVLANDVDMRHAPVLNGRLFEGAKLLDAMLSGYGSVNEAVYTLNEWMKGSRQPGVTFAIMTHPIGWQWWRLEKTGKADAMSTKGEVNRVRIDYPRMRTGLLAALMSDAYYCYDFGTTWYGYPLMYAEYQAPLGQPMGDYREVFNKDPETLFKWKYGQLVDRFILSNKARITKQGIDFAVKDKDAKYRNMFELDTSVFSMEPGKYYRFVMECEMLSRQDHHICARFSTRNGGIRYDRGTRNCKKEPGEKWHAEAVVKLTDFDDYTLRVDQQGYGAWRLKSLEITQVDEYYLERKFQGGVALLNPMTRPVTVKLDSSMRRIKDNASPKHIIEIDDLVSEPIVDIDAELTLQRYRDVGRIRYKAEFKTDGEWKNLVENGHHYGDGYKVAETPGQSAVWSFVAPSSDNYTVYAWMRGGDGFSKEAVYCIKGAGCDSGVSIDQSRYNGEWVKLFETVLGKGKTCEIVLQSKGDGLTCADAVRIESAARYNDGAAVDEIRLEALDGIILLNDSQSGFQRTDSIP